MTSRPTIFLSSVSHEFGSFRDAVEKEVEMKGCFAENQPGFPPDYHTVEAMLRRKIHDSDAVVHIVGFRFGAEPNLRPAGLARRSYTQMEFDIARELGKPVYIFVSTAATLRDKPKKTESPEDTEAVALQKAHREAVKKTNHLYYEFSTKEQLCKLIAEIPPVASAGFQVDISRIIKYAPAELIGRESELALLNDAWSKVQRSESPRPHVLTFVALGGEGKTSLVSKWTADLAGLEWPGCEIVFAWSFYNQGTNEHLDTTSDWVINEALTLFGEPETASSSLGALEKGRRLAQIIGSKRALFILDGLEPLQFAPASSKPGELKDQGLAALLKGLAAKNQGLCLVTTRYSVSDLRTFWETTAPEVKLLRLTEEAGIALLRSLGVKGNYQDHQRVVEEVKGHALTLNLLGSYLHDAHGGDIIKRDLVKLEEAEDEQGGHAFRVMDAYVEWFESAGEKGTQCLSILQLLGLFDRPVPAGCLKALLHGPAIPGLTEQIIGLSNESVNIILSRLESAKLLTVNRSSSGNLISVDAHPLLREYFTRRLQKRSLVGFRSAHKRLFEHLVDVSPGLPTSIAEATDLVDAIRHGNAARLFTKTIEVHFARIDGNNRQHLTDMLGAPGAELEALSSFFERPWTTIARALKVADRAYILRQTAMVLRASGRLEEAEGCLVEAVTIYKRPQLLTAKHHRGKSGRDRAVNAIRHLAQLYLLRGRIPAARETAEQAVNLLDTDVTGFEQVAAVNTLGDILHISGQAVLATALFKRAEFLQRQLGSHPRLRRLQGYRYCDLLLDLGRPKEVVDWTTEVLGLPDELDYKVGFALALLVRARASLMLTRAQVHGSSAGTREDFETAVDLLRNAGQLGFLSTALIARADLYCWERNHESAKTDLNEAWEIAGRGPMQLHIADIHLYRARLFYKAETYPWESPEADLAAAEKLINECGYHRRDEELADAKAALKYWNVR